MEPQLISSYILPKEDHFRKLIEGLNVITYEYDLTEHRFVYVSKMAEEILGFPPELWKTAGFWYNHLHDEDKKWASDFSREQTILLKDHEFEYRMIAIDGTVKWFKDITSVNSRLGRPKTLRGVLIDITERKNTEKELEESKERYKALVEQQTEMITRWKPDGRFTYVNEVFCDFFEMTREELIGKTYIPQMPVEDLERFSKFLQQLDKDNPVGQFTHRIIRPCGEIRWLKWTDTAIFDNAGNIAEYQTVVRDITARKNAEEALRQSEEQLQLIFDNAPVGMAITDFNKKFIRVNKAYCDIVGYSKNELLKMTFESITHPGDKELDNAVVTKGKAGDISNTHFEKRYIHKSGRTIFVELHVNVLKNSRGIPKQHISQVVDITERKNSDETLKKTQERLSAVLNNLSNVAIYEYGDEINFMSENIIDILGYTSAEFMRDKNLFGNLMIPDTRLKYDDKVEKWINGGAKGVLSSEIRVRNRNNDIIWLEDHMYQVTSEVGTPYFSGIMIDITEQKKTQERIRETETKLAAILTNLPKVVVYQSGNEKDFISENIKEMIGYTPEDVLKEKFFFGGIMHPDDFLTVKQNLSDWKRVNEEGVLIMEFRLKRKNGSYIWIEDHMFRVKSTGGEPYLSGILIDVTERKVAEEKISASLREKELLLKEIHHRVKNNLQVVSSLLKLQSGYIKDKDCLDILTDSQNRVRSMALVHQKLYQSKDFSEIDFSDYLRQLSQNLFNVFVSKSNGVSVNVKSEKIKLSIDLAIPCGLIINELVSNSLKYAFPEGSHGEVNIGLEALDDNSFNLVVSDNGVGLPKNMNFKNTTSLGLQLVNTLVSQLDGTIEMKNHVGTTFKIKFANRVTKNRI